MNDRMAAYAASRFALSIALALAALPAGAAALDEHDASRLAEINEAIQSFENKVSASLHDLPPNDAEQIEAYSYVELNLEAAHERLNTIFMLVAVSIYMESPSDRLLILNVMHEQLLPQSKRYLFEKADAIASMAATHPTNETLATYKARAAALLADRAVPLLDDLYRRTGEFDP
jgi:hypothetical protein